MPYKLTKTAGGYKVKHGKKALSKKALSKKRARAQMTAVLISQGKVPGVKPLKKKKKK